MMAALDLTRSQVSAAYLVGTLLASLALPRVGRALDEYGTRRTLLVVAVGLAVALGGMGLVVGAATLTLGFVGIRMLGQGVAVAHRDQRGRAMVRRVAAARDRHRHRGRLVAHRAGAAARRVGDRDGSAGASCGSCSACSSWSCSCRSRCAASSTGPHDVGQHPDGDAPDLDAAAGHVVWRRQVACRSVPSACGRSTAVRPRSHTRRGAAHSRCSGPSSGAAVATGMLTTALAFHQIDLLGEQGLTLGRGRRELPPADGGDVLDGAASSARSSTTSHRAGSC